MEEWIRESASLAKREILLHAAANGGADVDGFYDLRTNTIRSLWNAHEIIRHYAIILCKIQHKSCYFVKRVFVVKEEPAIPIPTGYPAGFECFLLRKETYYRSICSGVPVTD